LDKSLKKAELDAMSDSVAAAAVKKRSAKRKGKKVAASGGVEFESSDEEGDAGASKKPRESPCADITELPELQSLLFDTSLFQESAFFQHHNAQKCQVLFCNINKWLAPHFDKSYAVDDFEKLVNRSCDVYNQDDASKDAQAVELCRDSIMAVATKTDRTESVPVLVTVNASDLQTVLVSAFKDSAAPLIHEMVQPFLDPLTDSQKKAKSIVMC